jgi:ubiquinol oxidase
MSQSQSNQSQSKQPSAPHEDPLKKHHPPIGFSDQVAFRLTKFLRFIADSFFAKRYGHRAVVLETVAAVPGMVGGMVRHMRSLRRLEDDRGWIHTLLSEAENERMHLMTFIEIAQPSWLERMIILLAQGVFFSSFLILYVISKRTAHRLVGYFEEEAVYSYTE